MKERWDACTYIYMTRRKTRNGSEENHETSHHVELIQDEGLREEEWGRREVRRDKIDGCKFL